MKKMLSIVCFLLVTIESCYCLAVSNPLRIGEFTNYHHDIGGTVYILDNETLFIKGFTYDGTGPDAFFFVGKDGTPSSEGTIIPYPDNSKCYSYDDESAPLLTQAFNGQDITLKLPCSLDTYRDVKWISVWCRAYSMDFGSLVLAEESVLDEEEDSLPETEPRSDAEPEYAPHAESEPTLESEEYQDVYPETEPEAYLYMY